MAEILGLVAGGAGLASLAIQLAQTIPSYVSHVKSAPEEIEGLKQQLEALAAVWDHFQSFISGNEAAKVHFRPESALQNLILSCMFELRALHEKLTNKQRKPSLSTQLKWPLATKECLETIRRLYQCQQAFQFCLDITHL